MNPPAGTQSTGITPQISPRWLGLYASLAMMAGGWLAGQGLESLSRHLPRSGPPNSFDGRFDPGTVVCIWLYFAGMALAGLCCLWILLAALLSPVHRDA